MRVAAITVLAGVLLAVSAGCQNHGLEPVRIRSVGLQEQPGNPPATLESSIQAEPEIPGIDLGESRFEGGAPVDVDPAGVLQLSAEKAVLLALERNRALEVERYRPVRAGTFVETERARFDPVLNLSGVLERDRDRSFDDIRDRFFSIDGNQTTLSAGVSQRFLGGTEVGVDLELESRDFDNSRYSDQARLGLNLTQALLRGGGVAPNLAAIRQAEVGVLESAYELRGFTENLVAEVENAFWNFGLARRQVEIFQESFELAKRQLETIRSRIAVGQLAETEETVADAELALRQQQLIDARNSREQARLNLLRLLNPPSARGWERQIELDGGMLVPEVRLGSAVEHEALALKLRPDLNQSKLLARSGELETVRTANGLLPRLDLFITLGKTGYSQSFGDSFSDLNGPGYDLGAGLELELPVGNRAARALDLRARAGYQQALASIDNLEQLISLEVRNALLEVDRALQQIDASASRRILQEEVVRAETVRFRVGSVTALDVARVQRDLLESRISEVEAIVNYRKALIDLYLKDGTLLLRRGIAGPGAAEVLL